MNDAAPFSILRPLKLMSSMLFLTTIRPMPRLKNTFLVSQTTVIIGWKLIILLKTSTDKILKLPLTITIFTTLKTILAWMSHLNDMNINLTKQLLTLFISGIFMVMELSQNLPGRIFLVWMRVNLLYFMLRKQVIRSVPVILLNLVFPIHKKEKSKKRLLVRIKIKYLFLFPRQVRLIFSGKYIRIRKEIFFSEG